MEAAKHTITVQGLQVTYYQLGTGEPLLFLHGGRLRALTFRRALRQLAQHYTVIAPDIPGYGTSETPTSTWSYIEYATFFDSFLSELGQAGVTVVGYSMGGGIAFNLAAVSSRVKRLVLVDAAGLHEPRVKRSMHHAQRLFFYLTRPHYYPTVVLLLGEALRYAWGHRRDRHPMWQVRQACYETSYTDQLARVSAPTLLLWGHDDHNIPLKTAERFHEMLPGSQLKILPGIHDWPVYNPLLLSKSVL